MSKVTRRNKKRLKKKKECIIIKAHSRINNPLNGDDIFMSKVVNLFDYKKKEIEKSEEDELSFEEIMERNKKNQERIRAERAKENKNVTQSYGLKD